MTKMKKISEKYGFSTLSRPSIGSSKFQIFFNRIYLAIREIYRAHFKRYVLIAGSWRFLQRRLIALRFLVRLPFFWNVRFFPVKADVHFGGRECLLEEDHYETQPYRICDDSGTVTTISSHQYTAAAVYAIDLKEGVARANVDFFEKKNQVIYDHQIDLRTDYLAEIRHGAAYVIGRGKLVFFFASKVAARFPNSRPVAAFNFSLSRNYAHFLMELLPRLVLYDEHIRDEDTALLVDQNLHATQYEAIAALVKNGEKYALEPKLPVHITNAKRISSTGYIPYEALGKNPFNLRHHGVFHPVAMNMLVEKAYAYAGVEKISEKANRKIFISRESRSTRTLINAEEIRDLAIANGYEIVSPETLSFKEQVRLFAQAKKIICPTGAATANCLFCRPETELIILCNNHPDMIWNYWPSALASRRPEISYLIGPAREQDLRDLGIHASFTIDPEAFRQHALS